MKVAEVSIVHDLGDATGHADLAVAGITFGKAFQPDALTPLTFGVIADVAGILTGEGHIRWTKAGVTSSGTFATKGMNLDKHLPIGTSDAGSLMSVTLGEGIDPIYVAGPGRRCLSRLAASQPRARAISPRIGSAALSRSAR